MPFRRKTISLALPSLTNLAVPDVKWTERHVSEVSYMMEAADLYVDRPESVDAGRTFANALLSAHSVPEPLHARSELVFATVMCAGQLGSAYAGLYSTTEPPPMEVFTAMQWASFLVTRAEPADLAAASIFCCVAGHLLWHEGPDSLGGVISAFNWPDALRAGPPAAAVASTFQQMWRALVGIPPQQPAV